MDHKQVWSICTILINFCRKEECFLGPTKIRPTNVEGRTRKGCPWMIMQVDCRATGLTQTPLNLWKATSISMRPFKIPGFRNSQSFKPSLHKWITMDDTHAALYISLHIYMYCDPGRTSTPLARLKMYQQHLLPHSTKPHAWSFYLYQWKGKASKRLL